MTGFASRPWSVAGAVFLGLLLMRCAYGETPGIDAAPVNIPMPENGGDTSSGGIAGSTPAPTGGGGNAPTGGGGSAGNASAGGGAGGTAGTAGSAGAPAADGGAGGAAPAGGAGGESMGGQGGDGSGIVGGDPYGGTPWPVPGTIEAENFDLGGEGVGYSDTTAENLGDSYRTGDAVDIEACTDAGGGFDVGWNLPGEWRQYTVEVASSGSYELSLRVATPNAGANVRVEVDGMDVTGSLAVPNTGDYQTWQTITGPGVTLSRGIHVIRTVIPPGSTEFNINWLRLD